MGTPHQGGSGVAFGRLMVNIASVFVAAHDRLLRHLEQDSEWLQQQPESATINPDCEIDLVRLPD
jgi:hypothetical protein